MNFRLMAGTCVLLVVLLVFPAAALPDIENLSPATRTGKVWVTMNDINGTGTPESMYVSYTMGTVAGVVPSSVQEDAETGVVTITMHESDGARGYTFLTKEIPQENDWDSVYKVRTIAVAKVEGRDDYLFVNGMDFGAAPAMANYYADAVPEGKQHEWIDLNWKDPAKDLNLTVYAPDETFGPYSDAADGRKDGRIFLDFGSLLNVTAGNWFFKVQNNNQEYTPYTLNTYSA
ncbi:MAG: hypothetical protein LUQ66_09075 [Methanoregula sp.]|nr:hypothetical protein [Methanoregula sp.]